MVASRQEVSATGQLPLYPLVVTGTLSGRGRLRVVVMGDISYADKSKFPHGPWCEVGDYVCYGKHSGSKLFYQGQRFILLFDDQILMTVDSPKHLDPTYNLSN